jgi:hypothetical protein
MTLIDSFSHKFKFVLAGGFLFALMVYSAFIYKFDNDLLLNDVSSKEIYFEVVFLEYYWDYFLKFFHFCS